MGILTVALLVRLGAGMATPMSTKSDAGAYLRMASGLADGTGLVDVHGNRAYYSAGYPIFLGLVFMVVGKSLTAVWVVNLLLAVVSVFLVFRIGVALLSERVGLLAAAFWAIYVPSILNANCILKENLMIPLMLVLVWLVVTWPTTSHRLLWSAIAGMTTGMLALVGPTGCVVAGVLLVVMWVWRSDWSQYLYCGGAFALLMFATLAPWLYRNHVVLGSAVLNTNGGFNLYLGNNPVATGSFVSIGKTPMALEWNPLRIEKGELAATNEARRQAREFMKNNPQRTLILSLKKAAIFWKPPKLRSLTEREPLTKRILRYVWFVQYMFLLVFAILSLSYLRIAWPLYMAMALYTAIHMPFYVMGRYQLPIMTVLCVLAASSVIRWLPGGQRRECLRLRTPSRSATPDSGSPAVVSIFSGIG
ncbi:MAG: glycosyltransferase family 39 protein [Pirellulaceae bacterium]